MQTLQKEFDDLTLLKMFEVEVIDKRTNEQHYIIFNISLDYDMFTATHEAMNTEQQNSNKIAFVQIPIDSDFTLDSNLQEIYSACIETINESEFFELAD